MRGIQTRSTMAKKERDVVLQALVAFERHTRNYKNGGWLELWLLAKDALEEYRGRDGDN